MSSCRDRSSEVDARCSEIAAELRGLDQYVSFEKVLTVLLQRYGVGCFEALQCGRVDQLPMLSLLMAIDSKVWRLRPFVSFPPAPLHSDACNDLTSSYPAHPITQVDVFLAAWFAVRSVLTLRDLESDCAQFLHSFNVPTLHSLHPQLPDVSPGTDTGHAPGCKMDPGEIDLEAEAEDPAVGEQPVDEPAPDGEDTAEAAELCGYAPDESGSFDAFGVGPLLQHPRVASRFHPLPLLCADQCALLDSDAVMQLLLEYLVQLKAQAGVTSRVQLPDFAAYLCEQQGIYSTAEAGVLLQGSLQAEVQALQHALSRRYSLFVQASKRELAYYNQQMREMDGQGGRKKSKKGAVADEAPVIDVDSGESQPARTSTVVAQSPPVEPFSSRLAVHAPSSLSLSLTVVGDGVTVVGPEELQPLLPLLSTSAGGDVGGLGGLGGLGTGQMPLHQWDGRQVGRWGEALVYQYLLAQHSMGGAHGCGAEVEWLNEHEESRACYDLVVRHASGAAASCFSTSHYASPAATADSGTAPTATAQDTVYVEVKSSRYSDRNVFELSLWEWQFACAEGGRVPYHIYRVFAAGDAARVRIVIITDLVRLITEGRVKLCLAV